MGLLFVLSGSSCVGKTTLLKMLLSEFEGITANISYTTRKKREGEKEGVDYFFVDEEAFFKKKKSKEIVESVFIFGNYYGSSDKFLSTRANDVICDLDPNGAIELKRRWQAILIFISSPCADAVKIRLKKRGEENIEERLRSSFSKKINEYHYHIINDNVVKSYDTLRSIYIAEKAKLRRP